MSSSILASINSAIGILGFRITEMGGETYEVRSSPSSGIWPSSWTPCSSGAAWTFDDFKNLPKLLWISAFSRVGSIDFGQNHGPEQFVVSYRDKKVLEDMLLKTFSHLEEKWLREQGLQYLKDMPTDSKHPNEGPPDTDHMPSLEAFAVAVIGSELRLQLDV
ncbi:hypothetical protein LA080_014302 [Diaporthe eres]|nr:hypothetical protein LA080_014302 [Diaporthe eres]